MFAFKSIQYIYLYNYTRHLHLVLKVIDSTFNAVARICLNYCQLSDVLKLIIISNKFYFKVIGQFLLSSNNLDNDNMKP